MKPERTKGRKIALAVTGISILLLLLLLFGELAVRAVILFKSKKYPTQTTALVSELGWKTKENFSFQGDVPDSAGEIYALNYQTDENGFRAFGELQPDTSQTKVFFLGDSFTQSIEVSNDKTYYGLLDKQLDIEAFAYGSRGFSTLQELMFLEKYYDQIQPEIVVWQFCSNDFMNNSLEMERNSIFNNNRRLRPYYTTTGDVEMGYPTRLGARFLNDNLMFMQLLLTSVEKIWNSSLHKKKQTSESKVDELGLDYAPFQESYNTTKTLLKKVQEKLDTNTQLIIFTVGEYQDPYYYAIESICKDLGIDFVKDIPRILEEKKAAGENIMAKDHYHWNEKAHEMVAKELEKALGCCGV